jgi:hypothetical protein
MRSHHLYEAAGYSCVRAYLTLTIAEFLPASQQPVVFGRNFFWAWLPVPPANACLRLPLPSNRRSPYAY